MAGGRAQVGAGLQQAMAHLPACQQLSQRIWPLPLGLQPHRLNKIMGQERTFNIQTQVSSAQCTAPAQQVGVPLRRLPMLRPGSQLLSCKSPEVVHDRELQCDCERLVRDGFTCCSSLQGAEMVERVQWQGWRTSSSQSAQSPGWQGTGQG